MWSHYGVSLCMSPSWEMPVSVWAPALQTQCSDEDSWLLKKRRSWSYRSYFRVMSHLASVNQQSFLMDGSILVSLQSFRVSVITQQILREQLRRCRRGGWRWLMRDRKWVVIRDRELESFLRNIVPSVRHSRGNTHSSSFRSSVWCVLCNGERNEWKHLRAAKKLDLCNESVLNKLFSPYVFKWNFRTWSRCDKRSCWTC